MSQPTSSDPLLTTDFGVDALYEAAHEQGISTSAWPSPAPAEDLVAFLLAHEADAEVSRVLRRARVRVRYRGPATTQLAFAAKEALPLPALAQARESLENALAQALPSRGFPPTVRVRPPCDAAAGHFAVDLPSRWMRVSTANEVTLAFRGLPASIRYANGELEVSAGHPVHVELLVSEAGRAWFGDPRFFRPAHRISLRPLQRGKRAFKVPADLAPQIERVRMIDCEWDSGRAVNLSFAGDDCPREMKKLGLHIEGGELLSSTLRFDFTSEPRQADVTLRPPNELLCSEASRAPTITDFLARAKVLTRKRARTPDLWALDPWTPSDAAARAFFGDAFDGLVSEGVLVPTTTRAVAHPDWPAAGRRLIAFPLPGEPASFYGASDGMRIPARTLSAGDLLSFRLDLRALARRMAAGLGLVGKAALLERGGVLDLGSLAIGPTSARLFYLARMPIDRSALGERLRLRAMPEHAVLLLPAGRRARTGLPEVGVERAHGPYDGVLGDVAHVLGLVNEVEPIHLAPKGTRLVVHLASRRVWFGGVLLEPLREQSYRLVETLAKLGGATIDGKELAGIISGGANVDGATAQAKHGLKLAIVTSYAREGRALPDDADEIVQRVRKGEVRMGVRAFVA